MVYQVARSAGGAASGHDRSNLARASACDTEDRNARAAELTLRYDPVPTVTVKLVVAEKPLPSLTVAVIVCVP